MKWCMVAAMAVSLLFGGVAKAQEDNLDLDALLGDMDSAAAPTNEAAAPVETATEESVVAADEFAAPSEIEVEAPIATEPVGDSAMDEPLEAAPIEEVVVEETTVAPAEEDMLGDLFADESAPAADVAPLEEEIVTDQEEISDDFGSANTEDSSFEAPADSKKAGKEGEKLPAKEIKKIAKETAQQEEVRRQAAEAEALKASEVGFRALSDSDLITAEN